MIGAWTRRVVLAGCLLPLAAQAGVQVPAQQRCIVKAARAFGLVAQAQRRDVARCLRDSARGRLPIGQTPAACTAADGADRVRRARIRAIRTAAVACRDAPTFGWVPGAATDEDGLTGRGFARAPARTSTSRSTAPTAPLLDAMDARVAGYDLERTAVVPFAAGIANGEGRSYEPLGFPTLAAIAGPWTLQNPAFGMESVDVAAMRRMTLAFRDVIVDLQELPRAVTADSRPCIAPPS